MVETFGHILVIEDDEHILMLISASLEDRGFQVSQASNGGQAKRLIEANHFQAVVADLNLPDCSGMDILGIIKEQTPSTPVILITGFGSVDMAVESMRRGAYDFQEKPLNLEHLCLTIKRAIEKASLESAVEYLREEQALRTDGLNPASPIMKQTVDRAMMAAPTDMTMLITGESGTGKSLLARNIHANSVRSSRTMVTVNCAALTETLLESELFGHEKGAFTGAHKARDGRIMQANGGTLFLDEIGEMALNTQAKLLRAIEDKIIRRVGGNREVQVDVRIIAATNRDLEQAVADGQFRRDLYHRLAVAVIETPPLRDCTEDILPLAQRFIASSCRKLKRPTLELTQSAEWAVVNYPWPGNVRELRNAMERSCLFAAGPKLTEADLDLQPKSGPRSATDAVNTLNLADLERQAIESALAQSDYIQSRAASLLGITPRALVYKIEKFAISHPYLEARRRKHKSGPGKGKSGKDDRTEAALK